ncbi:transposase [Variovorax ginsengisoli]|uniref:Transposase n=1 Tax=Variovorax ginsengisoli TaxID=363844 RepID=A0ABT9S2D9_9BURK|nr:transposase [Variovorax ginsengisoli]MDP9898524.1 putative transposase [Variovorax ginsengisoli]
MARLPRLTLAGRLHHVIQRGNNRQDVFIEPADRERMLALLGEQAPRFGVALHAYVLMDNHFHLLVTPATDDGLPQFMQAVGRSYVRWFNDRHGRSGTLWEGRYRATLIQPERYLLTCMAYMDLNPVRAGQVADPREFRWSSHAHCVGLRHDRLVSPHPLYWALGNTPFAREAAYAELVHAGVSARDQRLLTESTLQGWAAGDADFIAQLEAVTPRRVVKGRAGRRPNPPPG